MVALEGTGFRVVAGQSGQDAFCGLACAAVGTGEELDGVVGAQQLTQPAAGIVCLLPSFVCELYAVVGNRLVDIAVLCRSMLVLAARRQVREKIASKGVDNVLLPSDWACLIRMISLGFPMVKKEERTECDVNNKWMYYAVA